MRPNKKYNIYIYIYIYIYILLEIVNLYLITTMIISFSDIVRTLHSKCHVKCLLPMKRMTFDREIRCQ